MHRRLLAALAPLLVPILACGFGGSESSESTASLDPWGLELELGTYTGGVQADGSYRFVSADGSSTLTVTSAGLGPPAAQRQPGEIAPGQVQWSRPRTYDGLSGMEARLTDAGAGQVHWVGAVDVPGGAVWLHLQTSTEWITTPTAGDPAWQRLANGLRRSP